MKCNVLDEPGEYVLALNDIVFPDLRDMISMAILSRRQWSLMRLEDDDELRRGGVATKGGGGIRRTPVHRFLQLDPSWFRKGQTTSLLASVMEKDEVKEDLGGILTIGRWPHQSTVRSSLECCDMEVRGLGGWRWRRWWWAGALVDKELNCELTAESLALQDCWF